MRTVVAQVAHEIPERAPLQLAPGELVQVGNRDTEWPEFVFVTADSGTGWIPARHLSHDTGQALVLAGYDTTELPTQAGEELEVLEEDVLSGWLWCRNASGREGWVPTKTVTD
jgi:hypothetical protein